MIENIEYIVEKDFEGELVILEKLDLNNIKNIPLNSVIYLKRPTPDIVLLFGKINGIIIDVGGKLSHFAIICRESNIGVVKFSKANENLLNNDYITIKDGKIDVRRN